MFQLLLGENHVDVAVTLNDFAILQYLKGNYVDSEELYLKSVAIYTSIFGNSHPEVKFPTFRFICDQLLNIGPGRSSLGKFG